MNRCHGGRTAPLVAAGLVTLGVTACGSLGAVGIENGREKYQDAIRRTGEEQMLLNLVRLQYDELPSFLQISTVSSALTAEVSAVGGATISSTPAGNVSITGRLTETPTVTYVPLQGEPLDDALLRRIPESSLVTFERGGWNVGDIFRMLVHDFGDAHNVPPKAAVPSSEEAAKGPKRPDRDSPECIRYEEWKNDQEAFVDAMRLLGDRLQAHSFDLDLEPLPDEFAAAAKKSETAASASETPPECAQDGASTPTEPLQDKDKDKGKDSESTNYPLLRVKDNEWEDFKTFLRVLNKGDQHAQSLPQSCDTGSGVHYVYLLPWRRPVRLKKLCHIAVTTRTLLEVMSFLSGGISTPEGCAHKRQTARCDERYDLGAQYHDPHALFRVYCSSSTPPDTLASLRVSYENHWFYIDRRDLASRRTFSVLMLLFQQQLAKAIPALGPVLTLPVTR
jgi:hypothetical protein